MGNYYGGWQPYVPAAVRRQRAQHKMNRLRKQNQDIQPIEIKGRNIATTFWGQAWCKHIESQGDYENRLPRGRTYVRNGSVCHLAIERGKVTALVSGSDLYNVSITIDTLPKNRWQAVQKQCSGQISSLLELLQGRISQQVMQVVTDADTGLFPRSREIRMSCDCPDYATMCKHVAAVLYGVGARLDHQPELLFLLRDVNHLELIAASTTEAATRTRQRSKGRKQVAAADLADVFGIELDTTAPANATPAASRVKAASRTKQSTTAPRARAARKTASKKKSPVKPAKQPAPATQTAPKKAARKPKTATKRAVQAPEPANRATKAKSKQRPASQKPKQRPTVKTAKAKRRS